VVDFRRHFEEWRTTAGGIAESHAKLMEEIRDRQS
jgi:hypothetical protein